ncbi:MAG: hypothetical protein AB7G28_07775 [Pirellulales bacterium]
MPADILCFAQSAPSFGGWSLLLLLMRFLHIFSSIILLGGIFYLLMVVAPRIVASGGRGDADAWFNGNRAAWAKWVGIATALLLISGLFNFVNNVMTYKLVPSYHMLGTLKILLGLVVFFFAAILAGKTALAESFREKMAVWLKVTLAVGIVIVIIGGIMRNYPRIPKEESGGPALVSPSN